MSTSFPGGLDTFPSGATLHGDNQDGTPYVGPPLTPFHSTLHGNLGDAVLALETKVGVNGSLDTASVDYFMTTLAARKDRANVFTVGPQTVNIDADGHKGIVVKDHSPTQAGYAFTYYASDGTTVLAAVGPRGHMALGNNAVVDSIVSPSEPGSNTLTMGEIFTGDLGALADGANGIYLVNTYSTTTTGAVANGIYMEAHIASDTAQPFNAFGGLQITAYNDSTTVKAPYLFGVNFAAVNSGNAALAYGMIGESSIFGTGTTDTNYAYQAVTNSWPGTTITNNSSFYALAPRNSGTIVNDFAFYANDRTAGPATNAYFLWNDSPGVFRVKADGVMAYYNPNFTKYTPGATAFERVVIQWDLTHNVCEVGTEKGTTGGTLRALRLIGAGVQVAAESSAGPDASAAFQVDSTTQGLAPPRGTTTQRNAIASPMESLIFYDTTLHAPYFWNGSAWTLFGNTYTADEVSLHLTGTTFSIKSGYLTPTVVGLGNVTNDAQTKAAVVPNTTPTAGQILVGNAGGTAYAPVTLSGSGATFTLSSLGALTVSGIASASLASTAVTAASYGDASHVATFTVNAQGQLTAAASTSIAVAAGAVSGLAAIATSGAITDATGTLLVTHGGTGLTTLTAHAVQVGAGTSTPAQVGPGATDGVPLVATGSTTDPAFRSTSLKLDSFFGVITADADAAPTNFNFATSNWHSVTLTASRTITFTGDVDGAFITIIFKSGGTGAFTPVWPSTVKWAGGVAPTLTNASGHWDLVSIKRESSGNYIGTASLNYF